jgi:hypothetical protein
MKHFAIYVVMISFLPSLGRCEIKAALWHLPCIWFSMCRLVPNHSRLRAFRWPDPENRRFLSGSAFGLGTGSGFLEPAPLRIPSIVGDKDGLLIRAV